MTNPTAAYVKGFKHGSTDRKNGASKISGVWVSFDEPNPDYVGDYKTGYDIGYEAMTKILGSYNAK